MTHKSVTLEELAERVQNLLDGLQAGRFTGNHKQQHRKGGADVVGLRIEEADGSPGGHFHTLKVTNATLTDNGDGTATVATGAGGAGGHTIRENGTDQTARTGLNFVDADAGAGLITDDAGGDETEINLSLYRLEAQDHSHASTGLQAGKIDHGSALNGLTDDDHTQYVLRSILTTRGDLFRAGASAAIERFAAVTAHNIVHGDGTDVVSTKGFIWTVIAEWYLDGRLRADTSNAQGKAVRLPDFATAAVLVEGTSIFGGLATTSAGAAVTFDIKHATTYEGSRTSIFSSVPSIAAGDVHTGDTSSNDGTIDTSPDYTAVDGGFYWLYVTQVGSTLGSEGEDLTVQVMAKVYVEF